MSHGSGAGYVFQLCVMPLEVTSGSWKAEAASQVQVAYYP